MLNIFNPLVPMLNIGTNAWVISKEFINDSHRTFACKACQNN